MTGDHRRGVKLRRRPWRELRRAEGALALVAVSVLAAACATGASPGVASVGSTTTGTLASSSAAGNSGPPPSAAVEKAQLAYSVCMRSHGVLNFPDPKSGGGYPDGYMKNLDMARYGSATKDCTPLEDAAGMAPWTKAQMEAHLEAMLKISQCMRANGVKNFPDPTPQGSFNIAAGNSSSSIDYHSAQYATAAKKCDGPPGAPRAGGA